MKVVHVITGLDLGGAEIMLTRLVEGMDRKVFESTVISLTTEGALADRFRATGARVEVLGMRRGRPTLTGFLKLVGLLREIRPELVQSWLYHADLMATMAAALAGKLSVIWNVRCADMDMGQYSGLSRAVQWALARCSMLPDAVVVNSLRGKDWHQRIGYRPVRWEIIENGFDIEVFRPDTTARQTFRAELKCPPDNILVGHIARTDPMKDHATFLAAAARVALVRPEVRFVLIGEGTTSLQAITADLGIEDRCYLLGTRMDIPGILPGLDILALSSISEGFPNVLGEAMACGVPCVSTDVGDSSRLLGDAGIVVPIRDPQALAEALVHLIDSGEGERIRLGRAGRRRIEQHFTLAHAIRRYEALYKEIADASRPNDT